ncbi:hypothetical protein [Streptomyces sp. CA-106131]|uniref:hypothetical protein n=1 Tax=Streptomyces sp. CA-106131 TaxID=3240045 RepID=UPI003D91E50E
MLTPALDAAREGAEDIRSGPVPREQFCVLRLAVRHYRTRAPRGLTMPGRAGRRAAVCAGTRPESGRLETVGRDSPQSRADLPLMDREAGRPA